MASPNRPVEVLEGFVHGAPLDGQAAPLASVGRAYERLVRDERGQLEGGVGRPREAEGRRATSEVGG